MGYGMRFDVEVTFTITADTEEHAWEVAQAMAEQAARGRQDAEVYTIGEPEEAITMDDIE